MAISSMKMIKNLKNPINYSYSLSKMLNGNLHRVNYQGINK